VRIEERGLGSNFCTDRGQLYDVLHARARGLIDNSGFVLRLRRVVGGGQHQQFHPLHRLAHRRRIREVARYDVNAGVQFRRGAFGVAGKNTDITAAPAQLGHHVYSNVTSCSSHQNAHVIAFSLTNLGGLSRMSTQSNWRAIGSWAQEKRGPRCESRAFLPELGVFALLRQLPQHAGNCAYARRVSRALRIAINLRGKLAQR
jgi:hypothetical protein